MFLHGMGSGSCLSYTGLVLPEHTNPNSQMVFLNDSQVVEISHPSLMSSYWSHFVALQANWFVSVSPLAFCLGVLLSIVASERLGRARIVKSWCQIFLSFKFMVWYNFRKMMFVLSNSIPLLCFVLLYFAPNFAIMLGKIKSKLTFLQIIPIWSLQRQEWFNVLALVLEPQQLLFSSQRWQYSSPFYICHNV